MDDGLQGIICLYVVIENVLYSFTLASLYAHLLCIRIHIYINIHIYTKCINLYTQNVCLKMCNILKTDLCVFNYL